jgi:hypothetical protein
MLAPADLQTLCAPACQLGLVLETAGLFLQTAAGAAAGHGPATSPSVKSDASRDILVAYRWRVNGWARHLQENCSTCRDTIWMVTYAARPARRRHKMAECQPVEME